MPHSTAWRCLYSSRVERGRAAAGAALVLAVADLVGLLRDGAADPAPPQVGAVGAGAVGLIGQHPVRPGARVPAARPGTRMRLQHGLELRGCRRAARR